MSAFLLAGCAGGGTLTAVPRSPGMGAPATTDFQRGLALAHFSAACGAANPGEARCFAYALTDAGRAEAAARRTAAGERQTLATTASGYGPAELQAAYGTTAAAAGAGSGKLVAIVDAYNDPYVAADLATYRAHYGLPPCTTAGGCLKIVNENGGSALPRSNASWSQEISLDVDMVSANCPNCKILLVETNSASFADLEKGVNTAAALGAVAISNSYGGSESSTDPSMAPAYNHPGIAVTVSNGDSGYGVETPASFPTVTAVGGTSLNRAANARGWSETVWSGSGSGCSAYESKPSWQHDASCAHRTVGDVAYVGDPYAGVAVYDSFSYLGQKGWLVFGGTSVGAPSIAAISALSGNTAGVPASLAYAGTGGLNDVVGGSNGTCSIAYLCTGEAGYDAPTGNGTPIGTVAF